MKKKFLLPVSIIVCIILVGGIFTIMIFREEPTRILTFALYDDIARDETYYVTLDNKGVLHSYYGSRYGNSIRRDKFMRRVRASSKKILNEQEITRLMLLLDNFIQSDDIKYVNFNGGIPAVLLYNDEVYMFPYVSPSEHFRMLEFEQYRMSINEHFRILVEELIKLSPISIDFP